ncbi:MAG: DUF2970 domain-containing protein [Burkholderiaceae bacterium]|nr:MAG: DUF2970 domain-containing protein [Burkholderiaceae bacterium]
MNESPNEPTGEGLKQAVSRKASFGATLKAVLSAFIGLRRGADHRSDMGKLNPLHVVIVGVLAAIAFVVTLIVIVKLVVAS